MEIQKENHLLEQFEKTKTFKRFFSTLLRFDEELDCFIATEKWRDKEAELLTAAWWMFAEVATAQPVPESFEKAYSEIFSPIVKRPYPRLENGDYKYIEIDQGWKLWQAAAAQAVPEGFVLVEKELSWVKADHLACAEWEKNKALFCTENRDITALQIEEYRLRWCKNKAHKIMSEYKAMIEAQEQSHECPNP